MIQREYAIFKEKELYTMWVRKKIPNEPSLLGGLADEYACIKCIELVFVGKLDGSEEDQKIRFKKVDSILVDANKAKLGIKQIKQSLEGLVD